MESLRPDVHEHLNGEGVEVWKLDLIPERIDGRCLDAGSGITEPYRPYLEPICDEYISVDIRAGAMVQADIASLPYPDAYFAFCWCSETLEHVEDAQSALNELRRVAVHGVAVWPGPKHKNFPLDPGHREVNLTEPFHTNAQGECGYSW